MELSPPHVGKEFGVVRYTPNSTLPGFTLKYPPSVRPGETVQLVAEFLPKEPKKVVSSNVTVQTSNANKPEILFYVFGNVKEWKFE